MSEVSISYQVLCKNEDESLKELLTFLTLINLLIYYNQY